MNDIEKFHSNHDILRYIRYKTHRWNPTEMTYFVMGTMGPTGKTWLVNQLKDAGYRAIDVMNDAWEFVSPGMTSGNYMKVDEENKVVYISLNDINDIYLLKRGE